MSEMEELDLDLEGFEEVANNNFYRFPFPAITICSTACWFNKAADPYVPDYFTWYVNDEWCVLKPCDPGTHAAYKSWVRMPEGKYRMKYCLFPSELQGNALMLGSHKLYKTKHGGIAFKRYEKLEANT